MSEQSLESAATAARLKPRLEQRPPANVATQRHTRATAQATTSRMQLHVSQGFNAIRLLLFYRVLRLNLTLVEEKSWHVLCAKAAGAVTSPPHSKVKAVR